VNFDEQVAQTIVCANWKYCYS